MKTRYALALAGLMLIPAAQAGDKPGHGAPPPHAMDMAMDGDDANDASLGLNATQKQQVQAIHADANAKHEAIRKETQAKVRALLTPEQQKAYDARVAARDAERQRRMEMHKDRMESRKDMREERKEMRKEMKQEKMGAKDAGKPAQ